MKVHLWAAATCRTIPSSQRRTPGKERLPTPPSRRVIRGRQ